MAGLAAQSITPPAAQSVKAAKTVRPRAAAAARRSYQLGQSFTECLVVVVSIALVAMLGFSAMSSGIGSQSASMAEALAGGANSTEARLVAAPSPPYIPLPDFDQEIAAQPEVLANDDQDAQGSLAFAQGFASGLIDALWEELGALLSPIDTALALAELARLFATEFTETIELLYDELIAGPLNTLFNGTDYERGLVVGSQVSPFKAVSVLAKASGAAILVAAAKRAEDIDGIPRINGQRPRNYEYAGDTHPSGVKFNEKGFPDFSPYAIEEVKLDGLTGRYRTDAKLANEKAGLAKTPKGYVWHHVEDGKTMQLIPRDIHQAARHTGGAAVLRENSGR